MKTAASVMPKNIGAQDNGMDAVGPDRLEPELERIALSVGIPPRPGILVELSSEAKKENPNHNKIDKLISSDVGLSATLIKTINSPFYGLRNKATSVSQAIQMLGLSTISRMVTGMALKSSIGGANQASMESFWDASAKIALVSAFIAKQLPGVSKDEAYTFGLFQDCGIPVLMARFPNYKETLRLANQSTDRKFTTVEDEIHQVTHATIGYLLAKNWSLPEIITKAIRFHHELNMLAEEDHALPAGSRNLVAIASLAESAIRANVGLAQTAEWENGGSSLVLNHLGLSTADFEGIVEDVSALLHKEGH